MSDEETLIISREEKRADLLEGLALTDWPADKAAEVVDLALHACEESLEVLMRICNTGSIDIVQMQAMLIAGDLITSKLEYARQTMEEDEALISLEELQAQKTQAN